MKTGLTGGTGLKTTGPENPENHVHPVSPLGLEQMPLVLVKYCGLQEGFAQLAPRALFNVVGGEVPELLQSTVTLESLVAKGYQIKEAA